MSDHKICIFALRDGQGATYKNITAKSIYSLFKNANKITDTIDSKERFNLFYTAAQCKIGTREDHVQEIIPFDIDDIAVAEYEDYLAEVENVLKVDIKKCGVVLTGNGLQILVPVKPFITDGYFKTHRSFYKAWCDQINEALKASGLPGHADPSVFSPARLLRLPFTKNIKKDKPEAQASLLFGNLEVTDFELTSILDVKSSEQTKVTTPAYRKPEPEVIFKECSFMKHAYENRGTLKEYEWFAALGITAFFEDDDTWSHKISEGHPSYTREETDAKANHAREADGPRTCESISTLWSGCAECPHKGKCTSPVQLRNQDTNSLKSSGFTTISSKGKVVRDYDGLLKHFTSRTPFIHLDSIERLMIYTDGKYENISAHKVKEYAQKNFLPPVKEHECSEFLSLAKRSYCTPATFINRLNQQGLVNFSNGVFDLESKKLMPHSKSFGFTYKLDYEYNSEKTSPVWDELLDNLTLGRKHLRNCLEEYIAFCFRGGPYHPEKILILAGDGNNGKTTFIKAIKMLIGDDNCSFFSMLDLSNSANAAVLEGKLINICEEEPIKVFSETGMLKRISGGSTLQVANKYERAFALVPTCKIIMSYNEVPFLKDTSIGMQRRLFIIPFNLDLNKHSDKKIKDIFQKLELEKSGIFNRIVEAYDRFKKRNYQFEIPKETEEALGQMVYDSDSVQAWWTDRIVMTNTPEDKVTREDMFEDFRIEMEAGKEDYKMSRRNFIKRIKNIAKIKKLDYKRMRSGSEFTYGFYSVKIQKNENVAGAEF